MKRFLKDESGMTMALAVIMIVVIGVMGAGLLTFVRNDLEAVVEVNQGQVALKGAEAGAKAAERHLALVDAKRNNYDANPDTDADGVTDDSEWSEITAIGVGEKRLDFDGDGQNDTFVKIRYLTPSTTESEASNPNNAPEVNASGVYPNSRNYFKVISRNQAGGATRQIESIYRTTNHNLPTAYYATRDIDLNGNVTTVNSVSVFAGRDITDVRVDRITGTDLAYGNWKNGFNNVARSGPAGVETTAAGVAALRTITYSPNSENTDQKNGPGAGTRYGKVDFDTDSDAAPVSSKEFTTNTWGALASQPTSAITFPFATGTAAGDDATIETLKRRAISQGKYIRLANGANLSVEKGTGAEQYPGTSDLGTVFFVEFAGGTEENPTYAAKGTVTYSALTDNADGYGKGIVVVVNGDLVTNNSADSYEGVFVVRDPNDADAQTMEYKNSGNMEVRGFANVEGDITLSGDTGTALVGGLVGGIPGVYSTELWSWRECYSLSCD